MWRPRELTAFHKDLRKEGSDFGTQLGSGWTVGIPPGPDRADLGFLFFFPNWQYKPDRIDQRVLVSGAWFYRVEAELTFSDCDKYLVGFSPLMAQYKFLSPERKWAPNLLIGAGFSLTDWKDVAERKLGTEFQFLLHGGAGLEFLKKEGACSINYRFFHVSNAGIKFPNRTQCPPLHIGYAFLTTRRRADRNNYLWGEQRAISA